MLENYDVYNNNINFICPTTNRAGVMIVEWPGNELLITRCTIHISYFE